MSWLNLQKARILGSQEKPLSAKQGILRHLRILMVQEFHDPLFRLEVCCYDPPSRVTLDELREVEASNSQSPRFAWWVQYRDEDPKNLQKESMFDNCRSISSIILAHYFIHQSNQRYQIYQCSHIGTISCLCFSYLICVSYSPLIIDQSEQGTGKCIRPGNHSPQSLWYSPAKRQHLCAQGTNQDGQGGFLVCICQRNSIS